MISNATWRDSLSDLQSRIISCIDTGNNRDDIVSQVIDESPEYDRKQVHRELNQMKKDWLVIHMGGGYYQVTAWSHDGIIELTQADSFEKALNVLAQKGVFHCDMERNGVKFKE